MRDIVIQLRTGEYGDFVSFLQEQGFEQILLNVPGARFMSKPQLFWQYLRGIVRLAGCARRLQGARHLVVFGHFAYLVKLLARMRLIRYRKLICFAFFVHDPKMYPFCRQLVRLDRREDFYIVFSQPEVALYQRHLGIDSKQMVYLPYADWGEFTWQTCETRTGQDGEYYIAGGSSNRDYTGLIAAFRLIAAKLVIVCSESNWQEFRHLSLPVNVSVMRDIPSGVFETLLRGAKAGIIPLKRDTGASGQSVALALMRNSKGVIATDAGALREYVDDGVSGFLLRDLAVQLPGVLEQMENNSLAEMMGRASRARYEQRFSRRVAEAAFSELLRAA